MNRNNHDVRPIPDPTELTTEQLRRELAALDVKFQEQLAGVKATFEARLDGMDKASALFDTNLNRVPTDTDKQISHLRELQDEKFNSIEKQFVERDTRVAETAINTKVAVDAALSAAEKAVDKQNESFAVSIAKSEAATTKQIDQQGVSLTVMASGLDGKIGDVKDRVTRLESKAIGGAFADATHQTQLENRSGSSNQMIAIVGVGVAILSIAASAVVALLIHNTAAVSHLTK